jgi:hypothetical protein
MFLYCSRSDRNFGESASISQRRVLAIGYYSAIGGDVLPGDPMPSSTDQESDDFGDLFRLSKATQARYFE